MLNVSIIIPAWNEQDRIADCLTNAIRQTVMPHEVIVVDNRSTDDTTGAVERFMEAHPQAPIRLLHQDAEQGLIPTRNFGLNAATGDVLGRIDADCMLKPDWVEVVAGIFTEDAEAMGGHRPGGVLRHARQARRSHGRRPRAQAHVPRGRRAGAAVRLEHGAARDRMAPHRRRGVPPTRKT